MKKPYLFLASLSMLLSACGASGPTYKSGEKVFIYNKDAQVSVLYDLSDEAGYNINIQVPDVSSVNGVQIGRTEFSKKDFGFKNGILTLKGELLKGIASGEKTINITPKDGRAVKIPALFCDALISTPAQFQAINDNLDGTYALVNDLDFSNFGNFEPLGRYISETDTTNHYFHGILEGNGYSLKNMQVFYSQNPVERDTANTYDTNHDTYSGTFGFKDIAHKNGDNIGVFQIIGSSGIVRNLVFDNVKVKARTIGGVVAGNVAGTVENVLVKENCSVKINTHYYDNDCNVGGAFGIVGGSGQVRNCVNLSSNVSLSNFFIDYSDDYKDPAVDEKGNGWDHVPGSFSPDWKYVGVDRKDGAEIDSNGSKTNGVYSFVGKCWGSVSNCLSSLFEITPYNGTKRNVCFGQTHLGSLKPTSGDSDLGLFSNCNVYDASGLKSASNYNGFDNMVWNVVDGSYPSLKAPQVRTGTIK